MDQHRKEFVLDARLTKLKKIIQADKNQRAVYEAQAELPEVEKQLRQVQRRLYGWRFVKDIYGEKDDMLEMLKKLRRKVLRLENEEIQLSAVLDNYDSVVKRKKEKIAELQGHLSSDIGFTPDPKQIEAANEELVQLHHEAAEAEIKLPIVQKELKAGRAKLEALEADWVKAKKHSDGQRYDSPGLEVDARTKDYISQHGCDYETAMRKVLAGDPILSFAYMGK
jgi:chromosome segregation ATPase